MHDLEKQKQIAMQKNEKQGVDEDKEGEEEGKKPTKSLCAFSRKKKQPKKRPLPLSVFVFIEMKGHSYY